MTLGKKYGGTLSRLNINGPQRRVVLNQILPWSKKAKYVEITPQLVTDIYLTEF